MKAQFVELFRSILRFVRSFKGEGGLIAFVLKPICVSVSVGIGIKFIVSTISLELTGEQIFIKLAGKHHWD